MKTYIDTDGVKFQAAQTDGPCIINTVNGERVALPGDWIISPPGLFPGVVTDADFRASFTEVTE